VWSGELNLHDASFTRATGRANVDAYWRRFYDDEIEPLEAAPEEVAAAFSVGTVLVVTVIVAV
jgi:hypothetical protein